MKLIYHQKKGTRYGRENDWLIAINGKEYHIVENNDWVMLINPEGEVLYLDKKEI